MIVEFTNGWKLYGKDKNGKENVVTFCKERDGKFYVFDRNANRGMIANRKYARQSWVEYANDGYTRKK